MSRRRRWAHHSLTVVGATHRSRGQPGGDAAGSLDLKGGAVVLIVADGAGRSTLGPQAADLAVSCLSEAAGRLQPIATEGPEGIASSVEGLFDFAVTAFVQEARRRGQEDDLSTTLGVVLLVGPWLAYAGVGDAFVVATDRRHRTHVVVPARPPGAARNETTFLAVDARPLVRVVYDPGLSGVVLSTDGLEPFLEERIVEVDGVRYPVVWRAPEETFGSILADIRSGTAVSQLVSALAGPAFQSRKGDDIGLAVALR